MKVIRTNIDDVKIIVPQLFEDSRGHFLESWRDSWGNELGIKSRFVQDNCSSSFQNTLRGLHYQIEHPQGKLVRVTHGSVFDVAVDMRKSSPTFSEWVGCELSDKNNHMLWIPPGFAHGFLVLSERAELMYKCTDYYFKPGERVVKWDDPDIAIEWPVVANGLEIVLSEKDSLGKSFRDSEYFSSAVDSDAFA